MNKLFLTLMLLFGLNCESTFNYEEFYNLDQNLFKGKIFSYASSKPFRFDPNKSTSANWYKFHNNTLNIVKSINDYQKVISNYDKDINFFCELTNEALPDLYIFTIVHKLNEVTLLRYINDSLSIRTLKEQDIEDELVKITSFDLSSRVVDDEVYDLEYAFLNIYHNDNYYIKVIHTLGEAPYHTEDARKIANNEYELINILSNIERKYF